MRYFEDYVVGEVDELDGEYLVTEEEIREVGERRRRSLQTQGFGGDVAFLHTAEATGSNPVSPTTTDR